MEKKMRNVFVLLIVVLAASVAQAGTTYFGWVTEDGVFSYTDDRKQIPARYREACALPCKAAEEFTLGELADYERFTVIAPAAEAEVVTQPAPAGTTVIVQAPAPVAKPDCGTVRIRSERRDVETNAGGSNTRFFIAEDDCGVLFDAPFYPELNALRR